MKLKAMSLQRRVGNDASYYAFFLTSFKEILKSKLFWIFMLIGLIVFILVKSLNVVESINTGIESTGYFRLYFTSPSVTPETQILGIDKYDEIIKLYGDSSYTKDFFDFFFNHNYIKQMSRMEIVYNFYIIGLAILISYVSLFRKIKNGSILVYLSTSISKRKMMFFSLLASFLWGFLSLLLLHTIDSVVTLLIIENFGKDNIQSVLDKNFKMFLDIEKKNEINVYFVSEYSKNTAQIANDIYSSLISKSGLNLLNFFALTLFSSTLYITIVLGLVYMVFSHLNTSKTFLIFVFLGVVVGLIATVLTSSSTLLKNEIAIYILKFIFFPNLINDLIVKFLIDYAGFSFISENTKEALNAISKPSVFDLSKSILGEINGANIVSIKDNFTGETWIDKNVLFIFLPLSLLIPLTTLPLIYRRIDWK